MTVGNLRSDQASTWTTVGILLVVSMSVLHVLVGIDASGHADMYRDIYWAQQIARGAAFPFSGPPIYNTVDLGPWWYYALALPLALSGSLVAVPVTVLALASLKYWFAWYLGLKVRDSRLGALVALAMLYCGWSVVPLWFPTHTALVETSVLLLAIVTLGNLKKWGVGRAILLGLVAGMCLHAHPTTVLLVIVGGSVVLWRWRSAKSWALVVLSGAIAFALLMPPFLDDAIEFKDTLLNLSHYAESELGALRIARFPVLFAGVTVGGPWNNLLLTTEWGAGTVGYVHGVFVCAVVVALCGLLAGARRGDPLVTVAVVALCLFCAQLVLLAALRANTPIWMVSTAVPPLAFAIGCGWWCLLEDVYALRLSAFASIAVFCVVSLAPFGLFLRRLDSVRGAVGADPFWDVANSASGFVTLPHTKVRLWELEGVSRELCGDRVLHGQLGTALEQTFATALVSACGSGASVRFGGQAGDPTHVAGFERRVWCAIGIAPERAKGAWGWSSRVRAIAPENGGSMNRLEARQVNPRVPATAARDLMLHFETRAADVVFVGNRFIHSTPMRVLEVRANGVAVRPAYEERSTFAYRCDWCSSNAFASWDVRLNGAIENLDIFVVEPSDMTTAMDCG